MRNRIPRFIQVNNSVSATENKNEVINKSKRTKKILIITSTVTVCFLVVVSIVTFFVTRPVEPEPTTPTTIPPENDNFISREQWGGKLPKSGNEITERLVYLVVKHTGGIFCDNTRDCKRAVRDIQSLHFSLGAPDIWYNFLIGGDGKIYVGRGWYVENEKNRYAIDVAFIGNFEKEKDELSDLMENAAKLLISTGIEKEVFTDKFKIVNHNQTECTNSPGENVAKFVKFWDNYSSSVLKPCDHPNVDTN